MRDVTADRAAASELSADGYAAQTAQHRIRTVALGGSRGFVRERAMADRVLSLSPSVRARRAFYIQRESDGGPNQPEPAPRTNKAAAL
ncbi:hypothetical protein MTO96_030840 [Rhipicephalus appendiculatus]